MIDIGVTEFDGLVSLDLGKANRHGLVTGATGTGKTVTLQRLAEGFSRAGVPVFAADVKGDLSGVAIAGDPKMADKAALIGRKHETRAFPVQFWDLFSVHGLPIKTSIQEMGAQLLASMLRLNETQAGALAICFKRSEKEQNFMLTTDDLRWSLNDMLEEREAVCKEYGNISASSISTIQRNLLALEAQGGDQLFGEPSFDVTSLIRTEGAEGVINLLHADRLMEAPKLYATFLLWLLTQLFAKLPECGDLTKPKMVFFFDEAHLLFQDAPKPLLQQIERLVRLVRSKGVGVYFVTQTPKDVPDSVLAQLGNRIQHALRAYTPKDQRAVKAAAQAFRVNPDLNIQAEITEMGVGYALASVLDDDGVPTITQKVKVIPPSGQIGPVSDLEREALMARSPINYVKPTEQEQFEQFNTRMHADRGIEIQVDENEYKEGDFVHYVPNTTSDEVKNTSLLRRLTMTAIWIGVAYGGVVLAGG